MNEIEQILSLRSKEHVARTRALGKVVAVFEEKFKLTPRMTRSQTVDAFHKLVEQSVKDGKIANGLLALKPGLNQDVID